MFKRNTSFIVLIVLLPAVALAVSACGGQEKEELPQQVILEPGLVSDEPAAPAQPEEPPAEPETEAGPEDEFSDLGRASTIGDLMANKEKITSYYFEQTIDASYGAAFIQTWYADGWMKISIQEDGAERTEYFDCENLILISHIPVAGDFGRLMTFEAGDPDMPRNHLDNDYHSYRVTDTDSIEGQTCRVMENRQGEKLWVSTLYGFPLQVEFNDPTNDEHFVVNYENLAVNQHTYADVAVPDDLPIIEY